MAPTKPVVEKAKAAAKAVTVGGVKKKARLLSPPLLCATLAAASSWAVCAWGDRRRCRQPWDDTGERLTLARLRSLAGPEEALQHHLPQARSQRDTRRAGRLGGAGGGGLAKPPQTLG